MATGWDVDEMTERLKNMSPTLQEAFLRAVEKLYEKESNMMLRFIDASRAEMRSTASEIRDEQDALRDRSSRMAHSRNEQTDRHAVQNYIDKRERENTMSPDFYCYEVEEKLALERYIRKREKTAKKRNKDKVRYMEVEPARNTATPDTFLNYEEEAAKADELMRNVQGADARIENERERQLELMRQRKEKKRAKQREREDQASELLELASEHEKVKTKDRERQEQLLKEKLEEKKKMKVERLAREETLLMEQQAASAEGATAAEPAEEGVEKEEKKKKKKKKKKEHDEEGGEDDEERKEKKKKKKKKKDKDKDREEPIAIEEMV